LLLAAGPQSPGLSKHLLPKLNCNVVYAVLLDLLCSFDVQGFSDMLSNTVARDTLHKIKSLLGQMLPDLKV